MHKGGSMYLTRIRWLFVISGLYDCVIGLAFLGFGSMIYDKAGVPPPNHWGYIDFSSMLLVIFGIMFLAVAAEPRSNRNFIPFGMLLKLSYVGLVTFYWIIEGVPMLFKPFVFVDALMLVLFVEAYYQLRRGAA